MSYAHLPSLSREGLCFLILVLPCQGEADENHRFSIGGVNPSVTRYARASSPNRSAKVITELFTQHLLQILTGEAGGVVSNLFWCTFGNDSAAIQATLWPHINNVIS